MITRKRIAAAVAAAALGIAGTVVAADGAKDEGCAKERQASGGEHRHGQGMERMQERHARMAERHARHGAEHGRQGAKEEEHKH